MTQVATSTKWTKKFAVDLIERVFSTALYGLIVMLTADSTGAVSGSPQQWWLVVGLPTALALVKGVLANMASPETGASLVPESPPGPKVNPEERGAVDILYALGVAVLVLAVLLLVTTLLKVFVVSWIVLIVLAVLGLFLLFWRGGGVNRL